MDPKSFLSNFWGPFHLSLMYRKSKLFLNNTQVYIIYFTQCCVLQGCVTQPCVMRNMVFIGLLVALYGDFALRSWPGHIGGDAILTATRP